MKKLAIATILALTAATASAVEVGVTTTKDHAIDRSGYGVTVGEHKGAYSLTLGAQRFIKGEDDQNRYSLVAGYDVYKVGPVTITPKVGVAYLDNQYAVDGFAVTGGVGFSAPVTKTISLTADVARQYGQERVKSFNGNLVTFGLSYKF